MNLEKKALKNTVGKGETIGYQHFLHFPFSTLHKEALVVTCLQYKSFENTMGKGEMACSEQFLLFPQCFIHDWITLFQFHYNLKLSSANSFTLSVWKTLKLVVWERVKVRNCHFNNIKYVPCKCFQFGHVQNFVVR